MTATTLTLPRTASPDRARDRGASDPTPLAPHPIEFRVLWSMGGDILFRDHTGRFRPIHVIRLRCLVHTLFRMANETRNTTERTRLSAVHAEAVQALRDVMAWRWAARGLSAEAMAAGGAA